MKYILVTGGLGFIGTNLVIELLKDPNNFIYIIDNNSSSSNNYLTHATIISDKRVYHLKADVCEICNSNFWVGKELDEIYHLACPASPIYYWKDPIHTLDTCYIGTKNILNLATSKNAKVVFTSTSEVYGDALVSPQTEEYYGNTNCFGERSCYDEGKRVAEALCYEYINRKEVDVRIARLFNCYGDYMNINDGRIVTEVIKALKDETPLNIYGDGEQTRSFCYVADTVKALIKLMELPRSDEVNSPINIGNPEEQSINKMVEETKRCWEKLFPQDEHNLEVIYKDKRQDDPMVRKPNIEKANKVLDWKPLTEFSEGIEKTILYFLFHCTDDI